MNRPESDKGQCTAIIAIGMLKRSHPNAVLFLVGDGRDARRRRSGIRPDTYGRQARAASLGRLRRNCRGMVSGREHLI